MRMAIITIGLAVLLVCGQAGAIVEFNDGGYHLIDYVINETVQVDHYKPNTGTQVDIASGGWIKENIEAYGTSRIAINGGNADGIITFDDSRLVMNSGSIVSITAVFNNEIEIHGGQITEVLTLGYNSSAIITSGTIRSIGTESSNNCVISGGIVLESIGASGNGLVTLIGSDFQVNGHNVGYGDRASTWATPGIDPWGHPWLTGTVMGILDSGDVINNSFMFYQNGDITFVPEPATFLIILTGSFIIRSRKRK